MSASTPRIRNPVTPFWYEQRRIEIGSVCNINRFNYGTCSIWVRTYRKLDIMTHIFHAKFIPKHSRSCTKFSTQQMCFPNSLGDILTLAVADIVFRTYLCIWDIIIDICGVVVGHISIDKNDFPLCSLIFTSCASAVKKTNGIWVNIGNTSLKHLQHAICCTENNHAASDVSIGHVNPVGSFKGNISISNVAFLDVL